MIRMKAARLLIFFNSYQFIMMQGYSIILKFLKKNTEVGRVTDSRRTLYRLMQLISHRDEGEPVFIEIE